MAQLYGTADVVSLIIYVTRGASEALLACLAPI